MLDKLETGLSEQDMLLWKAMEALAQLRPSQPVLNELEKYFGVGIDD